MTPEEIRRTCVSMVGAQKATFALRIFARVSLPGPDVVVLDEVIAAGDEGISVAALADRLQLDKIVVSGIVDSLRAHFLQVDDDGDNGVKVAGAKNAPVGDSTTNGDRRVLINFRAALSYTAAVITKGFGHLMSLPLKDIPERLRFNVVSAQRNIDDSARFVVCLCGTAQRINDVLPVFTCRVCQKDTGIRLASHVAQWMLTPGNLASATSSVPFVVPKAFVHDSRLPVLALLFDGLLFDEPLSTLTSDAVIPSAELLLARSEMLAMAAQLGTQSLRFVQPKRLRLRVATVEDVRRQRSASATTHRRELPPWLQLDAGSMPAGAATAGSLPPPRKQHRAQLLVGDAQLPADEDFVRVF